MNKINTDFDTDFNACLINRYQDGNQAIGAHSDSLVGLSKNSMVASISIGAQRKFRIKEKNK